MFKAQSTRLLGLIVAALTVASAMGAGPARAGVQLRFSMSAVQAIVAPPQAFIAPASGYTGVMGSGGAVPAADTTVYGSGYQFMPTGDLDEPRDMWIEQGCDGSCIGDNYTMTVVAANGDRAQIDHVTFSLEGSTTTVKVPYYNPRTNDFGYNITVQSAGATGGPGGGAGCNGDVTLVWDIVPVNGPVRRGSRHFTLNTQTVANAACSSTASSTTGPIAHAGPYFVDNAGSDANNGLEGAPFATLNKAMSAVPNGATVKVTSGQTIFDEAGYSAKTPGTPSAPCRMVRVYPSAQGQPYTLTKASRYSNNGTWNNNGCATQIKSATYDMSKFIVIGKGSTNATSVWSDVAFLDPYGAGGPSLKGDNCTKMAAVPCMYGPPDTNSYLFAGSIGSKAYVIDSARPTATLQFNASDFVRNWTNADIAMDVFATFASTTNGTTTGKSFFNSTVTSSVANFQRNTTTLPQNMVVSGVNYCSTKVAVPPINNGLGGSQTVDTASTTAGGPTAIVEFTRNDTSFTASINGQVMTVSGTVTNGPIYPGMVLSGTNVATGTYVTSYAGRDGNGNDTWNMGINKSTSATQNVASTTMTTAGTREVFGNGIGINGNNQSVVYGSGSGSLNDKGAMIVSYYGNAVTDWTAPSGDATCSGTLVRAGHPFIVSDCKGGAGYQGVCDSDPSHAMALATNNTTLPEFQKYVQGSAASTPVLAGQTASIFSIGHSDLGQLSFGNSTNLSFDDILFANVDWRGVQSQPWLYQTGQPNIKSTPFGPTMTASQAGVTFTVDPLVVDSVSYAGGKTTITWANAPPTGVYTITSSAGGNGFIGGLVYFGNPQASIGAGCTTGCKVTGGAGAYTGSFTTMFLVGDRMVIAGLAGIWKIVAIQDDNTMFVDSIGGLTSTSVTGKLGKAGVTVRMTSGALAGQELSIPDGATVNGKTSVNGDVSASLAAGDTAYINPGLEYGDFIRWTTCIGDQTKANSFAVVMSTNSGNQATLSRSYNCGPGSTYTVAKSFTGMAYLQSVIATNVMQETGFSDLAHMGNGGQVGWAFIDSTYYGAGIVFEDWDGIPYGIEGSAIFDSLLYNSKNSNVSDLFTWHATKGLPGNPFLNIDTNALIGGTAKDYGSTNPQAIAANDNQISVGMTSAYTFKPNITGTVVPVTLVKKGVRGNPNRADGCPIYPLLNGALLPCASALVGARQP